MQAVGPHGALPPALLTEIIESELHPTFSAARQSVNDLSNTDLYNEPSQGLIQMQQDDERNSHEHLVPEAQASAEVLTQLSSLELEPKASESDTQDKIHAGQPETDGTCPQLGLVSNQSDGSNAADSTLARERAASVSASSHAAQQAVTGTNFPQTAKHPGATIETDSSSGQQSSTSSQTCS